MADPLQIARTQDKQDHFIIPKMANRHGLIAGTTGTGKTVTVQKLAEQFSEIGVPVFVADVKGDFSGVSQPGSEKNTRVTDRVKMLEVEHQFTQYPVTFWDVFGEQGHPVRATVSDMGPLLLSRLLDLNETQTGVLNLVFKIADDNGLLLLDLKDLRAMVQFVGDNAKQFTTEYGMVSAASVGAIQRGLLSLESQGGDQFFGEPDLDLDDLMRADRQGRGMINVLAADKLMASPKVYSTLLLWLLAELFEELPEVGDLDQPKLVFFFDEAHLLFNEAPKALLEKIEQVVRLIRSKGVGVYFISQNPTDIPDVVLSQLGNRVQHALRAFTAKDQKAIRAAAETYRENPKFKVEDVITELVVGEALISFLDAKGAPSVVDRAFIIPPQSQIGPITPDQRAAIVTASPLSREYDKTLDRESAYEKLRVVAEAKMQAAEEEQRQKEEEQREKEEDKRRKEEEREAARRQKEFERTAREAERAARGSSRSSRSSRPTDPFAALAQSTLKSFGSSLGRELTRGLLGSLTGGRRR